MSFSSSSAVARRHTVTPWLAGIAIADVGVALTLGGGAVQGLWSDAVVQLCCLPLLGLALSKFGREPIPAEAKWPLAIMGAIALLPLLQLVPVPPVLWSSLPGHAPVAAAFQLAGMANPWEPLSLDPGATWFSFLSTLPAMSVFLATLFLDSKTRRILSLVILGCAFVSVLAGLGGPASPLHFYAPTNRDNSIGFYANSNHYAALLIAVIPISAAWAAGLASERSARRGLGAFLLAVAYSFLLLGIGMARSRAGLVLAFVAALASTMLAWGSGSNGAARSGRTKLMLFILCVNAVGLVLAFQFSFVGIANRLENQSVLEDPRWPITVVTAHAVASNLPLGVGLGAFEPVYRMFENPAAAPPDYVNHAHDDWLELTLDGGLPAIALMLAFLIWYARATIRIWREPSRRGRAVDRALTRAGTIVVGVLLLHSTVDYPLRTTSLMVVFAYAAALMSKPADASEPQSAGLSRRRINN